MSGDVDKFIVEFSKTHVDASVDLFRSCFKYALSRLPTIKEIDKFLNPKIEGQYDVESKTKNSTSLRSSRTLSNTGHVSARDHNSPRNEPKDSNSISSKGSTSLRSAGNTRKSAHNSPSPKDPKSNTRKMRSPTPLDDTETKESPAKVGSITPRNDPKSNTIKKGSATPCNDPRVKNTTKMEPKKSEHVSQTLAMRAVEDTMGRKAKTLKKAKTTKRSSSTRSASGSPDPPADTASTSSSSSCSCSLSLPTPAVPSEEEKEKEREREREREPPPVDEEQVEISVHCIDGMDGEVLLCVNGTRRMCFTVDKKIFEHGNPDRFLFTVPKNADPLELSVAIYEDRGLKYLEADGIINIRQYRYEPALVTPFTLLRRAPPAYRDDDNEARLPRFGRPPLDVYLSIEYVPERERERVPKM